MRLGEYLKSCNQVYHTTLNPNGPGAIRIHLIPPKKLKPGIPWVVILNGYSLLPIQTSWAVLLKEFMYYLNATKGAPVSDEDIKEVIDNTYKVVKLVFPGVEKNYVVEDLKEMILTFEDIMNGIEPNEKIGYMTLAKYAKYMSGPHRIDLMVSAMEKNGSWNCNQKCLHCYACGEKMANSQELTTEEWYNIIDKCKDARIPSLTFTGGEPTLRDDLPQLIKHASWFVTRLNTNGILLSKELCSKLVSASLDSVQVTLYSANEDIHNTLVGSKHFVDTIKGLKNAIDAGLDVSVNTPLCNINKEYLNTIKFCQQLGVRYFSCSGLIPSGNAKTADSRITALTKEEITTIVKEAYEYTSKNELEIAFTSPGWIKPNELQSMKMVVPSCGACLSNMAINPSGDVIPCQSWLFEEGLGNLIKEDFKDIWDSEKCKTIRAKSAKNIQMCPLRKENSEE